MTRKLCLPLIYSSALKIKENGRMTEDGAAWTYVSFHDTARTNCYLLNKTGTTIGVFSPLNGGRGRHSETCSHCPGFYLQIIYIFIIPLCFT